MRDEPITTDELSKIAVGLRFVGRELSQAGLALRGAEELVRGRNTHPEAEAILELCRKSVAFCAEFIRDRAAELDPGPRDGTAAP